MITENDIYADRVLQWKDQLHDMNQLLDNVKSKIDHMINECYNPWAMTYSGRVSHLPHDLMRLSLLSSSLGKEVQERQSEAICWNCKTALRVMNLGLNLCNACAMRLLNTKTDKDHSFRSWIRSLYEDRQELVNNLSCNERIEREQRQKFVNWINDIVESEGGVE